MEQKSAYVIASVLLLAVATAFALWDDVLKIHVAVNTGDVDIKFSTSVTPSIYEDEYEGKNVASCTATYVQDQDEENFVKQKGLLPSTWNPATGDNDLELVVTINNAYPGYLCKIDNTMIYNTGTIPVKILVRIVDENGNIIRPTGTGLHKYIDVDGDNCPEIDLDASSIFSTNGTQIHPGEFKTFSLVLYLPTERQQCIKENHTYKFYVVFLGYQWNEFPS